MLITKEIDMSEGNALGLDGLIKATQEDERGGGSESSSTKSNFTSQDMGGSGNKDAKPKFAKKPTISKNKKAPKRELLPPRPGGPAPRPKGPAPRPKVILEVGGKPVGPPPKKKK
tara:strand:- start:1396 stop:1740 length:345 start_codon:yes stop_codon:yes gene_type:complete